MSDYLQVVERLLTDPTLAEAARISRLFTLTETGCWQRRTPGPDGRGRIHIRTNGKERQHLAHRYVYELLVGPVPDGLVLDHLCSNTACANPAHLEPVTQRVNVLRGRGFAARNARKTHCPHGHEYTPDNVYWDAGARKCRVCVKARARRYHANRRAA